MKMQNVQEPLLIYKNMKRKELPNKAQTHLYTCHLQRPSPNRGNTTPANTNFLVLPMADSDREKVAKAQEVENKKAWEKTGTKYTKFVFIPLSLCPPRHQLFSKADLVKPITKLFFQ
jgi:hypothetical protein